MGSVDDRLVVEGCRSPTPSDDVIAAWRCTVEPADEHAVEPADEPVGDPARTAVGGAGVGANLAAGTILRILAHTGGPEGAIIDSAGGAPAPGAAPEVAQETRAPSAARIPPPAGVILVYPTLLAVQPAADATLRAMLDANPDADRFDPVHVRAMYENPLGGPVDDAPLPAVPGRAAASDLAGFPPVLTVNCEAGVPLELVSEPHTQHGHLSRPGQPAASVTPDRVVRRLDALTTDSTTEGSTP